MSLNGKIFVAFALTDQKEGCLESNEKFLNNKNLVFILTSHVYSLGFDY